MSRRPSAMQLAFQHVNFDAICHDKLQEIVDLCTAAYGESYGPLLRLYTGTTHVLAYLHDKLISHACWVTRRLQPGSHRPLRTAYIEHVATLPRYQNLGYGTAVMEQLALAIGEFELGALSTERCRFYERLGWEQWRGPLAIRTGRELIYTPLETVMVLRQESTPELDLTASLTAEWRDGELW